MRKKIEKEAEQGKVSAVKDEPFSCCLPVAKVMRFIHAL